MKRLAVILTALAVAAALSAPAAQGAFGFSEFDVTFTEPDGSPTIQAGSHPYEMTTTLRVNATTVSEGGSCTVPSCDVPEGETRDLTVDLPPGFIGTPLATPYCSNEDFIEVDTTLAVPKCPDASALGFAAVKAEFGLYPSGNDETYFFPTYNLEPPPGVAAKFGFIALGVPVTIESTVSESPPYNVEAKFTQISQALVFYGGGLTLWGNPADPGHDEFRGRCLKALLAPGLEPISLGSCEANISQRAFLTLPRSCDGPLETSYRANSWGDPGTFIEGSALTHDDAIPPNPQGLTGCSKLSFHPTVEARATTTAAASSSGLEFSLDVADEGLLNPTGLAAADVSKAVVTLPRGMTANPSAAEGLATCSEAQLDLETATSPPGAGCPEAAKLGTVEVQTPLLEQTLGGDLYLAEPYENPFGSLLALYVVIKNPELGIRIVQPLEVSPDPVTGQLITTAEDIPQLPFSHFRLRFREGGRAPLISPPGCGTFEATAELTPSTGGPPVQTGSAFQISSGPNGSPCPAGAAPFDPGFEAGATNNAAGQHSPFYMRLTRRDAEQDMTRFSATLPPGVLGKIAGIERCPEAGIARAIARTGPHGAAEELADPSCPAGSKIGRTAAGAGVGQALTYVPGSIYLAGPYNGAPLSVVAITPAKAGPFDVGTVVVREALALNPVTAQVEVDGDASDPIPHILRGIPLNLRDLRIYADRPEFTLNATSCEEEGTAASLWGGGTALLPTAETPVSLASRYQAAGCASLPFAPRLAIELKGGTRRGAHPALKAIVTPRPGDANFANAVVTLPRSAFLDQAHIRTICTRVQFAAGEGNGANCPKGALYGKAKAWSPLLDAPAQGPVYLRSSSNNLPDLVVALQGPPSAPFQVELSSRIDSVRGGIRSSFESIPDVPVSRFVLEMQGGKKGLIVNSRNLCFKPKRNRAKAALTGQNGRRSNTKPVIGAKGCGKGPGARR